MGGADCVTQRLTSMMEVTRASWEQHRLKDVWTLRLDPEAPAGHIVQSFIQRPHPHQGWFPFTRASVPNQGSFNPQKTFGIV